MGICMLLIHTAIMILKQEYGKRTNKGIEMKKFILLCALTLVVFIRLYPELVANLPELGKPTEIRMNDGYLFIVDQQSVLVYDLKSFTQIKKLCRQGEGPQEFQKWPRITFTDDKLALSDNYKVILFSKKFQYLREIKLGSLSDCALPIDDRFVITDSKTIDGVECRVFLLIDNKGQKIKDLLIEPITPQMRNYFLGPFSRARSWKDRVFIAQPHKGFYIDVFDKEGKKLYQIEKEVKQIKSQEKYRQLRINEILFAVGRSRFEQARKRGIFEKPLMEFVPAINNFWVTDDSIYVKTYDITATKEKYIIMDLQGNIRKTVFLPIVYKEILTFHNNTFYYLEDNEEKEN